MKKNNNERINRNYCAIGNIVGTSTDKDGIENHGTKDFSGGTKVYLCGKNWTSDYKTISVLGLNRNKR